MTKSSDNFRRFKLRYVLGVLCTLMVAAGAYCLYSTDQSAGLVSKVQAADKAMMKKKMMDAKPVVMFNEKGELLRPTGYRQWVYVGTPLTPNDMNNGSAAFPEFHPVYINRMAFKHYKKTGMFPDGTVLVKELVSVGSKEASSGQGYFMGEFSGLEVTIKDKTRFKDEPGNWAYFSFGHKYPLKKMATAQATASCNACHEGEAGDDWVFT